MVAVAVYGSAVGTGTAPLGTVTLNSTVLVAPFTAAVDRSTIRKAETVGSFQHVFTVSLEPVLQVAPS